MSVKPCPKRLNFYGQSVNFHRCVRKRQSFCQMQRLINQRAKLPVKFIVSLFLDILQQFDSCIHKSPDEISSGLFGLRHVFSWPLLYYHFSFRYLSNSRLTSVAFGSRTPTSSTILSDSKNSDVLPE